MIAGGHCPPLAGVDVAFLDFLVVAELILDLLLPPDVPVKT